MRPYDSLQVLWLIATLGAVTGCPDDTTASPDAAAVPQTALATPYDKRSSTLGATNVQDAIDELAQRPLAEAPLVGRLEFVAKDFPNKGGVSQTEEATCPDPMHDFAISGSCRTNTNIGTTLTGFTLGESKYVCDWRQDPRNDDHYQVWVLCLRNAR